MLYSVVARKKTKRPGKYVKARRTDRVFKTSHFVKQAQKAGISDAELCDAAVELQKGQGDSLSGGVWKKRLDKNQQRAIVLTKVDEFWIYVYLFAKNVCENISPKELKAFKKLSGHYQAADVDRMVKNGDLHEICKREKEK